MTDHCPLLAPKKGDKLDWWWCITGWTLHLGIYVDPLSLTWRPKRADARCNSWCITGWTLHLVHPRTRCNTWCSALQCGPLVHPQTPYPHTPWRTPYLHTPTHTPPTHTQPFTPPNQRVCSAYKSLEPRLNLNRS
jgi:hypothetical protein